MFPVHHHPGQVIGELFPGLGSYPSLPGPFLVCAGKPGTPGLDKHPTNIGTTAEIPRPISTNIWAQTC